MHLCGYEVMLVALAVPAVRLVLGSVWGLVRRGR